NDRRSDQKSSRENAAPTKVQRRKVNDRRREALKAVKHRLQELEAKITPAGPFTSIQRMVSFPAIGKVSLEELEKYQWRNVVSPVEGPTIWYHGELQYSIDRMTPMKVSEEFDNILQAFLESQSAMETCDIESEAGVTNVARAMKELTAWENGIFKPAVR